VIHIRDMFQQQLFDKWGHFGPKRLRILKESWAGLFQEHILEILPVSLLVPFFSDDSGRDTKEFYTTMGVLVLQQMRDLTDDEAVEALAFDDRWHFALDITDDSDKSKYMAPKTLWNYRFIVASEGMETPIFEAITEKLALVYNVDPGMQRIDSVHIRSNMRRLGRVTIFTKTIHNFLKNLRRQHKNIFDLIEPGIIDKYFTEKGLSCFAAIKPSQSQKTLDDVAQDLFALVTRFESNKSVISMNTYKQLKRVLEDQCCVPDASDEDPVHTKPPKEIPSDSLQNPSDPDATYSGHKGQGFQAQVMETYTDTENDEEKSQTLNLITHVELEKASDSDAKALLPAVESAQQQGLGPAEVLADSLYGSDKNVQAAEAKGVDVISPVVSEEKGDVGLSEFYFNAHGHVLSCPMGQKPAKSNKKKEYSQRFNVETCSRCDLLEYCPVKRGKNGYYLRYKEKDVRLAQRRAFERTDEFMDKYRWRAGVEATMSELDRLTGIKHLRVRGFPAVRYSTVLKVAGLNILRAARVQKARKLADKMKGRLILALQNAFKVDLSVIFPEPKPNSCFSITSAHSEVFRVAA